MPRTLVTRLAGRRVALSRIDTGFGPRLWLGEFRDERGRPITNHNPADPTGRFVRPVVSAVDIVGVLDGLEKVSHWPVVT